MPFILGAVIASGFGWGFGMWEMMTMPDDESSGAVRTLSLVFVVVGLAAFAVAVAARPISKVTARAWLAGWWHARHVRRHAANASGHASARARRSVTNKAAWAAQRQRSGRAARPEYGGSLRGRIIQP